MPEDLWRKAQDVDHAKKASKEIAQTGRLHSYEHVFVDSNSYQDDAIGFDATDVDDPVADWLNSVRSKSGKAGCEWPRFVGPIGPDHDRALPVLAFALRSKESLQDIAACVKRIGDKAIAAMHDHLINDLDLRKRAAAVLLESGLLDLSDTPVEIALSLLAQRDPVIRLSARNGLKGREGDAVRHLLNRIDDGTNKQRLAAIRLLRELGGRAWPAIPVLQSLVSSPIPVLRSEASRTLASMKFSGLLIQLREGTAAERRQAVCDLRPYIKEDLKRDKILKALAETLDDPDVGNRCEALKLMITTGHAAQKFLPEIEKSWRYGGKEYQRAVTDAIKRIRGG